MAHKLYIILHGTWAYVKSKNGEARISVPKIDRHEYRLGDRCSSIHYTVPKKYRITHLEPGAFAFSEEEILRVRRKIDNAVEAGCTCFFLPGDPAGGDVARNLKRGIDLDFDGRDAGEIRAKTIPMAVALEYGVEAGQIPEVVEDGPSQAAPLWLAKFDGAGIAKLHIYAEESTQQPSPPPDFQELIKLATDFEAGLKLIGPETLGTGDFRPPLEPQDADSLRLCSGLESTARDCIGGVFEENGD